MESIKDAVNLETFDRDQGINLCARIAEHFEGRVVVAVTGPEGCGKSLVPDAMLHHFDDDRNVDDIPNDGKSVMEEDPGDSLGMIHSKIVNHNDKPVRVTIVRNTYHLQKMDEFDGTDVIFFLHSWTKLPKEVKPSMVVDMKEVRNFGDVSIKDFKTPDVHRKWEITFHDQSLQEKLSHTLSVLKKESDYRVKRNKPTIGNAFRNVAQKAISPLVNALRP